MTIEKLIDILKKYPTDSDVYCGNGEWLEIFPSENKDIACLNLWTEEIRIQTNSVLRRDPEQK